MRLRRQSHVVMHSPSDPLVPRKHLLQTDRDLSYQTPPDPRNGVRAGWHCPAPIIAHDDRHNFCMPVV